MQNPKNTPSTNIVLEAKDLSKNFVEGGMSVQVFCGINLSLREGEWVSIVGASGSGKSTLLHLLGGLDFPTEGTIYWNGTPIRQCSEVELSRRRNQFMGFVYQFHHLLREFTAVENVAMPMRIRGLPTRDCDEAASEILKRVGLSHRLHHLPNQLSGGERQRVALARAFVSQPLCLLADEATGNLDEENAQNVMHLMEELSLKTALLTVTHDWNLARRAHRILRLSSGQLLEVEK